MTARGEPLAVTFADYLDADGRARCRRSRCC